MADRSGKMTGYKSELIGRQDLKGPAIDRIDNACDTNAAAKVNNKKWYESILKNRSRLDRRHERLLKD